MANASDTAKACVDAFLKHDQDAVKELLAPDVEWLENGLSLDEHAAEQDGRGTWEGAHSELDVSIAEVAGDDSTAVLEFDMSHGGNSAKGCAIFGVADGKVQSVHWYGHGDRAAQILWPAAA
jgi:SnoaL-like protein